MNAQPIKRVGFVGLGIMGSRMARNLARKGFEVTVWNRTRSRAEPLQADGIKIASSPAALASQVDAFCTCVSDPPALREALANSSLIFPPCLRNSRGSWKPLQLVKAWISWRRPSLARRPAQKREPCC